MGLSIMPSELIFLRIHFTICAWVVTSRFLKRVKQQYEPRPLVSHQGRRSAVDSSEGHL